MKKIILLSLFVLLIKPLFAQIEVRDSVFIKLYELEPSKYSFSLSDGKIDVVHLYYKNKYEAQTGYIPGYFKNNLTLKQKYKIDPKKVLTYDEYVKLINEDIMKVYYYYKVYFIISDSKYEYLTLQVRQMIPLQFREE